MTLLADDGMLAAGFPSIVATAFHRAATEMNAVVASRTPGPAALPLIAARHDLKSFYVHGKSCNWGPMAGYVCQLPPLSKGGAMGISYNLTEHLHSVELYRALYGQLIRFGRRANAGQPRSADRCFVGLAIADAQMQAFLTANPDTTQQYANLIVGVASNSLANVVVEWAAQSGNDANGNRQWLLYHRQIWIKRQSVMVTPAFAPYLSLSDDTTSFLFDGQDPDGLVNYTTANPVRYGALTAGKFDIPAEATTWVTGVRNRLLLPDSPGQDGLAGSPNTYYPLRGAQNPYPPYPGDDPRNAVAGDYDLFSVWPYTGASRLGVTRLAERNTTDQVQQQGLGELFRPVPHRPLTVELAYAPSVYVEVIPGYAEITPLEDPVLGNINDLVNLTVGVLNSYVDAGYRRFAPQPVNNNNNANGNGNDSAPTRYPAPNQAFHSDEGGRPGVTSVEYPVAVFIPDALTPQGAAGQCLLVQTPPEFVSLIETLLGRCELPLNLGWLLDLFRGLTTADLTGTEDESNPSAPQSLAERLASILAGRHITWTGTAPPPWFLAVGQQLALIDGYDSTELARTKVRVLLGLLDVPADQQAIWVK